MGRTASSPHPRLGELTDREREVLALVGEGLNNEVIAERLWISKATARTHVSNIMGKGCSLSAQVGRRRSRSPDS